MKCLDAFLKEIQREKQTLSIQHVDFGKIYFRHLISILSKQIKGKQFYQTIVENISDFRVMMLHKGKHELFINISEEALKTMVLEETDTLMSNLAWAYQDKGDLNKSIELKEKVLEKKMEVLGEEHPSTLTTMSNLALAYEGKGDLNKCIELNEKVLEKNIKVLGEEHPSTLTMMSNLAVAYEGKGATLYAKYSKLMSEKPNK